MSCDIYPKNEELTEEAILKASKDVESWKELKDTGTYTLQPGPAYRQMQLYHNRNVLTDSVRKTLARLYLETAP